MNRQEFAKTILRCSYSLWRAVLVGERNLGLKKAQVAAKVLVTEAEVWMDSARTAERAAAWEEFEKLTV